MSELTIAQSRIPAMSNQAIAKVRELEKHNLALPQVDIATHHVIHGGMYARTICIPAGTLLTGALIKVATVLIAHGDFTVYIDGDPIHLSGHRVLAASAGRKQAFLAHSDTHLTMCFPTQAKTVEDVEREFTDEYELLFSKHGGNVIVITGE